MTPTLTVDQITDIIAHCVDLCFHAGDGGKPAIDVGNIQLGYIGEAAQQIADNKPLI